MILYLDTSALVKRYIAEAYSADVVQLIGQAGFTGSSVLASVEIAATLAKAARMKWIEPKEGETAWQDFLEHWPSYTRLAITPAILERAALLAWNIGLRGYDALHLAAAVIWQEALGMPITLATFDRELGRAGLQTGLAVWPEGLFA